MIAYPSVPYQCAECLHLLTMELVEGDLEPSMRCENEKCVNKGKKWKIPSVEIDEFDAE